MTLPINQETIDRGYIIYWRKPTPSEIKFGYGAIHYRDFPLSECVKKDGTHKRRLKAKDDGLFYTAGSPLWLR
jgi:hypothetical protein